MYVEEIIITVIPILERERDDGGNGGQEAQTELSWQSQSLISTSNSNHAFQIASDNNGLLPPPYEDEFVLKMPNENCLLLVNKSGEFQLWRYKNEKPKQVTLGQLSLPKAARNVTPEVTRYKTHARTG